MAVFVVMGARELLPFFDGLVGSLEVLYLMHTPVQNGTIQGWTLIL